MTVKPTQAHAGHGGEKGVQGVKGVETGGGPMPGVPHPPPGAAGGDDGAAAKAPPDEGALESLGRAVGEAVVGAESPIRGETGGGRR